MKSLVKVGTAIAASFAVGCSTPPQVQELSAENAAKIDILVKDVAAVEGAVVALVQQAKPLYDAQGKDETTGNEQLVIDIETVTDNLLEIYNAGHIYQYDSRLINDDSKLDETGEGGESGGDPMGFYHETHEHQDDLANVTIAFDVANPVWNRTIVAHEVGHVSGDHSKEVEQALKRTEQSQADFLRVVVKERDFSYLLTALYKVPDAVLSQYRYDIEQKKKFVLEDYRSGKITADTAKTNMEAHLAFDKEAWLEKESNFQYGNFKNELDLLEINQKEVKFALSDPGLLDHLNTIRQEAHQEVWNEIKSELRTEARAEMKRESSPDSYRPPTL